MSTAMAVGRAWPMGAHSVEGGVNFAVFSAHATAIEVCLYDASGQHETARHTLPGRTGDVWHGWLPGLGAGCVYGLRAHGPWAPEQGHVFNPHKLLLDPYARECVGEFAWHDAHYGHSRQGTPGQDRRDNGALALKARVPEQPLAWQGDAPLHRPWRDTVLYEVHLRNFTMQHPGIAAHERGTFAGLASDAAIAHFQRLGVTALSLLPVQQFISEERLPRMGLSNHWGYNTLAFFAPHARYAGPQAATPGHTRQAFAQMVQRLHAAGIEVILDVVYNHTAEAGADGPTLSLRGLDNASYYRLEAQNRAFHVNWSGCGNTLNLHHPRVLQMVLDSLRYWVTEMHVDGFRFDLAPALARGEQAFEHEGAFFKAVAQDPVLAGAKLIAEPWDLGPDGWRTGQFPPNWHEWNDRFRDTMRAFWLGGETTRGQFAQRLCGSSDLFSPAIRAPAASVNYVVSHDGFTLRDLLSHNLRHNAANGEDNRDGHAHNLSWNCGHEGPTADPEVLRLRARLARALLACTVLAQGTPMLAAGDEIGHSQQGNNNPYCQDNTISWIDWSAAQEDLLAFTSRLIALRREMQPLGERWFTGAATPSGRTDVQWLRRHGEALRADDWHNPSSRVLGMQINRTGPAGGPMLLLVNAEERDTAFTLPPGAWQCLLDTSAEAEGAAPGAPPTQGQWHLLARSLVLLKQTAP